MLTYTLKQIKEGQDRIREMEYDKLFGGENKSMYHILPVILECLRQYENILIYGGEEKESLPYLEGILMEFEEYWM